MDRFLLTLGEDYQVEVILKRKNVKRVSLRVYPNLQTIITVPERVSNEWIDEFLKNKSSWIYERHKEYKLSIGSQSIKTLFSGMSIKYFGIDTLLLIRKADRKSVEYNDGHIVICTINLESKDVIMNQFEEFMRIELKKIILGKVQKLYPIIKKNGFDIPSVQIRKMKTMWGSCNAQKSKVNINFYLYQAPTACIEYVVLHELLHFIEHNHSKEFYSLLNLYMPDWNMRKSKLDNEVIENISL